MKTTISSIAIAGASCLLIAGCASDPAPKSAAPSAKIVSSIPKPDAAQESSLMAELAKIKPELANEKSVDNARNQCHSSILAGSSEAMQIESTKARFADGKVKILSDDEARQVIAVIKANGFCKVES